MGMAIRQASRRSGCTPPTIRYYERIGLLAPADRTASGRRTYGGLDVTRLSFIRRCRDFGLSIAQVRTLLSASEAAGPGCATAKDVVIGHLLAMRARHAELQALEEALRAIKARCETGCSDTMTRCSIFADIGLHGQ